MKTVIVSIDPGKVGGIAVSYPDMEVQAVKMPTTLRDIWDQLAVIACEEYPTATIRVYMEKVGTYMPGNSGPSAATFAEHVGALKMALTGLKYSYVLVLPTKWQTAFIGKQTYPKIPKEVQGKERKTILAHRKQERKNKIKARAQELYPHLNVTLLTSDAIGILHYGLGEEAAC